MSDIFIVRQPIFDRNDSPVGYELRFRDTDDGGDAFARSYLSGSFDVLRAGLPAYIRCSRRQLLERLFEATDPKTILLLFPADLELDADVLAAIAALVKTGVPIALDEYDESDPQHAARAALFPLATHIRIDLRCYTGPQLEELSKRLRAQHKMLIADHVEDKAARQACHKLGFDRFEGPHYSRPEPLPSAELPASTAIALQLLGLARNPKTSDRELENAISSDPSLTFQLLRLVNSAAIGGRGIQSIGHAIRLVGRVAFVRWLALAFAAARSGQSGIDGELTRQAVQRARMCEALGGQGRDKGTLFLVGLFSLLDAVFRMPLADVLDRVNLAPEAEEALLNRGGPYADALSFVEAYELGLWESVGEIAARLGVAPETVPQIYAEAVVWAAEHLKPHTAKVAA
jgi:EAL and modified HD-GYP domain-containing signal transduction protein